MATRVNDRGQSTHFMVILQPIVKIRYNMLSAAITGEKIVMKSVSLIPCVKQMVGRQKMRHNRVRDCSVMTYFQSFEKIFIMVEYLGII